MIGEGVSAATTGAGHTRRETVVVAWEGGRECCIAGEG